MLPEINFNWDKKKHDAKVERQAREEPKLVNIRCAQCKNNKFIQAYEPTVVLEGNRINFQMKPVAIHCTNCGISQDMETLTNELRKTIASQGK